MAETSVLAGLAYAATAAAAVGGTVVSVQSAQSQAKAASAAAEIEMQQYEQERQRAQDAAAAEIAQRDRQMSAALSAQRALLADQGSDPYGETAQLLQDDSMREVAADIDVIKANAGASDRTLRLAQQATVRRAGNAISTAGYQAAGAVASSVGSIGRSAYGVLGRSTTTTKTTGTTP